MERLQAVVRGWFDAGNESLTVGVFGGFTGASRKDAVTLIEHCVRLGWTVRVGDERRRG